MTRFLAYAVPAMLAAALASTSAVAGPITLKFAYFSSDRTSTYRTSIKPFVDAVNADPSGLVKIDVVLSGALGHNPAEQADLVLNGKADIAFVIPGYRPDLFPDDAVIQLPGLFNDNAEALAVYLRLVTDGALRGYERFHVVSLTAGDPSIFNMRAPVTSLGDLTGKRVRVNNRLEGAALEKLGITPVELPITKVANAIGSGEIDGALMAISEPLVNFGIARMTTQHYRLGVSTPTLAVLMNREVFESLPPPARDVVSKYSPAWLAEQAATEGNIGDAAVLAELMKNPQRKISDPSPADLKRARAAFRSVIDEWAAASPHNAELLAKAETALAHIQQAVR